jgi:AraC-like DNA-binding protein
MQTTAQAGRFHRSHDRARSPFRCLIVTVLTVVCNMAATGWGTMRAGNGFEAHLAVNDFSLPRSAEWQPRFRNWSFVQVRSGISYWQEPGGACELAPGSTLVLAGATPGGLRASQLNEVVLAYACMELEKLGGLLSMSEECALRKAAARDRTSVRILPPDHPVSERFRDLCQGPNKAGFSLRWQLLQLFIDMFKSELEKEPGAAAPNPDGRGRLREFLKQTTTADFLGLSLADLASQMHCSPRHLSRLFGEEAGGSFREKQTEMRLAKARQLLAASDAKVIDVGLACGYQSSSLFSQMFKKRFGISPGRWRQRHDRKRPPKPKFVRMLPA